MQEDLNALLIMQHTEQYSQMKLVSTLHNRQLTDIGTFYHFYMVRNRYPSHKHTPIELRYTISVHIRFPTAVFKLQAHLKGEGRVEACY